MSDRVSAPDPNPSASPGALPRAVPSPAPQVGKDESGEPLAVDPTPESGLTLADRTAEAVFGGEDNARETAGLIESFVTSWERRKRETPPSVWLADEFRRYPDLWAGDEEIVSTANEVVASVERANAEKASLRAHLDAGRSKPSWLAERIEKGAAAAGVSNVGAYAAEIDGALKTATDGMRDAVLTRSGALSRAPNLDGFIAERHHVDTFNLDAAAKGSPYRAEVLGSQGKNSVDVVIRDGDGGIVRPYQSKYGQDAEATQKLWDKGDYRGQRKLVPSGQEGGVRGSTDVIDVDGVRSEPLTKDGARRLQDKAQRDGESRRYEWNDINRIEIAKSIGKQALVGAALACGFQGARVLGRRLWNSLRGRENPAVSEDLRDFFASSIKSAAHVGAQTAVSGAVVVAARSGWIHSLKHLPAGRIVGIVHVGMENAKILFKLARGELNGEQALDAMGSCTASAIGALAGAGKGAMVGTALAGPVGFVVGGVVGGMAGSAVGEAVWEGGKTIVKTAAKAVSSVYEGVKEGVKGAVRWFEELFA